MIDDQQNDAEERLANVYSQLKVGEKWAYGGTGTRWPGRSSRPSWRGDADRLPELPARPSGMKNTDVLAHTPTRSVPPDMARFDRCWNEVATADRLVDKKISEAMLPRN